MSKLPTPPPPPPQRSDFQQALASLDTYTDISVDDLIELTRRAQQIAERRSAEAIGIAEVMSQPVATVQPHTPLTEAAHKMVNQRISGLPVVDAAGHLTGIITEADFLRALGVPDQPHHHSLWQTLESLFGHLAYHGELQAPDDPVAGHMKRDVVCVTPEQDLHSVLDAMQQHRVKRVVLCDADRRMVGIVTRSDLVRVFFDRYTHPVLVRDAGT